MGHSLLAGLNQTRGMRTIVTTSAAHDFLALVPDLAGFQPVESVVLVAFRGKRTCGALRADLPRSASAEALGGIASSLVGMICKIPGADALVPVVYTGNRFGSGTTPPHNELIDALIFHSELSGFFVRDALCVASDGWGSYGEPSTPVGGHPLTMIAHSSVAKRLDAERARNGQTRSVLDDQSGSESARATADKGVRQRVGKLIKRLASLAEDPDALSTDPIGSVENDAPTEGFGTHHALRSVCDLAESALSAPTMMSELEAATMIHALQNPSIRDELLLHWAFGARRGQRAARGSARLAAGESGADLADARLLWGDGPRPDPLRIDGAIVLLSELLARAPRATKPAALSMLAWLNWALGRSSRAAVFVRMAFEIDRDYGFAELLDRMLSMGRLPEWAFAVPSDEQQREHRSNPERAPMF